MMDVTRETKATLSPVAGGRVIGWHNDKEPRHLSVAVPGDRAKLTALEARRLAAWLIEAATAIEKPTPTNRLAMGLAESVSRW